LTALFDLLYNKCLARGSETEAICCQPVVNMKHCGEAKQKCDEKMIGNC
jgi:hypothetical protein